MMDDGEWTVTVLKHVEVVYLHGCVHDRLPTISDATTCIKLFDVWHTSCSSFQ